MCTCVNVYESVMCVISVCLAMSCLRVRCDWALCSSRCTVDICTFLIRKVLTSSD